MTLRSNLKKKSRENILEAAGKRLRSEGIAGSGIASVMSDAGLTHGTFYAHFKDKDELACNALIHALHKNRMQWIGQPKPESWTQRLARLAKRYLTNSHRQKLSEGCALAALCNDASRSNEEFKQTYEQELLKSLSALCQVDFEAADQKRSEDALSFMSLMIGSITLSRAVKSKKLSDRILSAGKAAAAKLAQED